MSRLDRGKVFQFASEDCSILASDLARVFFPTAVHPVCPFGAPFESYFPQPHMKHTSSRQANEINVCAGGGMTLKQNSCVDDLDMTRAWMVDDVGFVQAA